MNQTDIITFLTIASCKSLSHAANLLCITQPALSHRLSSLESELGTSLIVREKGVRTIKLTDAGDRFIIIAEKYQELWQEAKELGVTKSITQLRIANVDSLNVYFMPQVYKIFIESNTNCKLNIQTLRSNTAYQAIENHEIDLAFITNPHFFKKARTIPLFHESMKFICSKSSSYPSVVSPGDLKTFDEIYIPWGNSFLMWHDYWFGNNLDIRISIDSMGLLEQFLQIGNMWAIVPSTIAHALMEKNLFRICDMRHGPESRTCYAIKSEQQAKSQLQSTFISALLKIAGSYPDVELLHHDII